MNDIPRYRPVANDKYGITDDVDGKLCEYRDYASLKAEVERLVKAGDELHHFLIGYIVEMRVSSSYLNKLDDDWNAAKEGKQP